jgi:hypothetical protein
MNFTDFDKIFTKFCEVSCIVQKNIYSLACSCRLLLLPTPKVSPL